MGHHIDKYGNFQSDKHPDLPPNKIILSFKDPAARKALWHFSAATQDRELADDIRQALRKFAFEDSTDTAPAEVEKDHQGKSKPCGFGQT